MSFQNLLLGGPVIVVLEKNIPLESAVCFHQQRMCLWGGGIYLHEGKQMFETLPSVYC